MSNRIFVVSSVVPYRRHGVEGVSAAHVVAGELIRMLKNSGYPVSLQVMADEVARENTDSEREEIAHVLAAGLEVMPMIFTRNPANGTSTFAKRLKTILDECTGTHVETFYPATRFRKEMQERLARTQSDLVLTLWSPEGIAATSGSSVPQIAYHGDLEFAPWEARIQAPALFPVRSTWPGIVAKPLDRARCAGFKRAHLSLMKGIRVIANVTDSNARFYREQGYARSIYVRNTWPDGPGLDLDQAPPVPPIKIIGHVGYLDRTGSTFGLQFLLSKLMPALDSEMRGLDYFVHIIGSGKMAEPLRDYLSHPRLVMRGFVKDLDSELRSAHALLVLNNAGPYRAAFTRHILAWSMGLCLVAHSNSREAIPEMTNMQNCLMSDSPAEMARLIHRGITEPELNRTVRQGGRQTYERFFKPEHIAAALTAEIESVLAERGSRR